MNIRLLWAAALSAAVFVRAYPVHGDSEDRAGAEERALAAVDLLWAGAWKEGANLTNRLDLKLRFAGPGLTLRTEVLDRRPGDFESLVHKLPWEVGEALTALPGGLYHDSTGSRILYGPLEEWGLAARLRGPWSRGLPFAESHRASSADLRTAPSGKAPELYLYLGTPFFELPGPGRALGLRGFVSARIDPAKIAAAEGSQPPLGEGTALTAALGGRLGKAAAFSLEGFYTAASLPDRVPSGWFSETPPISLQDFSLFGLGLLLDTAYFDLSGDLAWSRTPILGGDLYASLGLRAGNGGSRPRGTWQLSLAADGAGRNYTGSDGANPGAGFRAGGKFEWRHSRAGLFRIDTVVSGPGFTPDAAGDPGLDFDRGSLGFSYRPPVTALPLRLSRLSVEADRDARDGVKDSAGLSLSLAANPRTLANAFTGLFRRIPGRSGAPPAEPDGNPPADPGGASGGLPAGGASRQWGSLSFNLSGSLAGTPAGDWGPEKTGRDPSPWPVPGGAYRFESFKAGGELVWSTALNPGAAGTGAGRRNLRLKAGLDYTASAPALDEDFTSSRSFDLQAALSGGWGRFSIGLSCPAFPWESPAAPWELSLSWKVERQAELRRGQP